MSDGARACARQRLHTGATCAVTPHAALPEARAAMGACCSRDDPDVADKAVGAESHTAEHTPEPPEAAEAIRRAHAEGRLAFSCSGCGFMSAYHGVRQRAGQPPTNPPCVAHRETMMAGDQGGGVHAL